MNQVSTFSCLFLNLQHSLAKLIQTTLQGGLKSEMGIVQKLTTTFFLPSLFSKNEYHAYIPSNDMELVIRLSKSNGGFIYSREAGNIVLNISGPSCLQG